MDFKVIGVDPNGIITFQYGSLVLTIQVIARNGQLFTKSPNPPFITQPAYDQVINLAKEAWREYLDRS